MSAPDVDVRALLADARARLADAPQVWLGELTQPRKVLMVTRAPRVEPRGRAWHLGVLLLPEDDRLLATGQVTRASDPGPKGFAAESARARAALALAASRGGFPEGETVHVGWSGIDLDAIVRGSASGPVVFVDGTPSVRWSTAGRPMPLSSYLSERVGLLLDPPVGA